MEPQISDQLKKDSKVTDTRLTEELLELIRQQAQQLEVSRRELDDFSYAISHDLRAPLRAIDGFTKVLTKKLAERITEEEGRYLRILLENTHKMGLLIDGLLSFHQMGRRKKILGIQHMDTLISEVLTELRRDGQLPDSVEIKLNELPDVYADRQMLKELMSKIIGNAAKFTGNVVKPVIEMGGKADNEFVEYYVKDNGVGFDMDYSDKIFGIFQRLHSEEEFEGAGVGLAIAHRIISMHYGHIWVNATPGEGAEFRFSFPVHKLSMA